jgi:predicted dehydrogenase
MLRSDENVDQSSSQRREAGMRFIQAGMGIHGKEWAEYLAHKPGYELTGVVEPSPAGRAWAIETLGLPPERVFPTIESALAADHAAPNGADAVLIVTPPETHLAIAAAALQAGKHVLSEKPMVPTLAEAHLAVAEADRAGKIYMIAQNYRFRGPARAIRNLIAANAIGPLVSIAIDSQRDMRFDYEATNFRYLMRHPYVIDMSIHHVDLIRAITGQNVATVSAKSWRAPDSPYRYDPAVAALITLESGAPVVYEGSGATYRPWTSWNGDWDIVGELGRIVWNGGVEDSVGNVTIQRWGEEAKPVALPTGELADRDAVLEAFRLAFESGIRPETSVHDNIHSLALVVALCESIDRGEPVRVADLLTGA